MWLGWMWFAACQRSDVEPCEPTPSCAEQDCGSCAVVAGISELSEAVCEACRDAACTDGLPPAGCEGLPCVSGAVVIHPCGCDEECANEGLAFCGRYTAIHGVCVESDDL